MPNDWVTQNASWLVWTIAGLGAALLVAALVFLILWRAAARRAARFDAERVGLEREQIELELELAEQVSRLRIVRELHEIAVHSLSVIISQADGAHYAAKAAPAAASRAAATIAESARSTLADLRRVMNIVREGEAQAGPQPSLGSVRELFKVMRDAGLDVTFHETGERLDLKRGAELAVYRILQEALANSLTHGGPGTVADVGFAWTETGLEVKVDDDGARAEARRHGLDPNVEAQQRAYSQDDDLAALTQRPVGRGITEMRERAELFGGVFDAHAVAGIGFSVSAMFPALVSHNAVQGIGLTHDLPVDTDPVAVVQPDVA